MNVQFLNPFIQAAHEVLKAEANYETTRGELSLEKNAYVTDDVTVILSLVGEVEGMVFYALSEKIAVHLASSMLGEELHEFVQLAQSGIAELGNVITGRASVMLSQLNIHVNISPPTLLCGKGATISTLDVPRIVVPLHSNIGVIHIHLALRSSSKKNLTTAQIPVPRAPDL